MSCCRQRNLELPVEAMVDLKDALGVLNAIVSTGAKNFVFKDAALESLALMLSKLVAENNYLKKLADFLSPPAIDTTDNALTISFGPGHVYTLNIPLTDEEQRVDMAKQLRKLADKLHPIDTTTQKQLSLFAE